MQIKYTALAVSVTCHGALRLRWRRWRRRRFIRFPSIKHSNLPPLRTSLFRLQRLHHARFESPARSGKNEDPVDQNDQCRRGIPAGLRWNWCDSRVLRVWNSHRPPRTGRRPRLGRQAGLPAGALRNGSEPGRSCSKSCDYAGSNCRRPPQWPGFCAAGHAWRRSRRPRSVHIISKCRICSADRR